MTKAKMIIEGRFEKLEVTYDDSQETKQKVFDTLLEFYKKHGFCGEDLVQSDPPWERGVPMLGQLADEVFQFNVKYEDEWEDD